MRLTVPEGTVQRRRPSRFRQPQASDALTVVDNWPATVPVTACEIDVIETYLGGLLDELLREVAGNG